MERWNVNNMAKDRHIFFNPDI